MSTKMDESDPAVYITCDGCGQPRRFDNTNNVWIPLKRCSRCRSSWYHDADCQKLHYKVHKIKCRSPKSITCMPLADMNDTKLAAAPEAENAIVNCHGEAVFTIQKRPDGELGVFALQDVQPIDSNTLMCCPFVPPSLFKTHRTSNCALCFRSLKRVKKPISLSNNPRYPVLLCSEECRVQSESWLPQETEILEELLFWNGKMLVLSAAVLVYRLLKVVPPHVYLPMHSHPKMMYQSTDDNQESIYKELVTHTVTSMIRKTKFNSSNLFNVLHEDGGWTKITEAVHDLLHRITFNGFSVVDHDSEKQESLGNGLFAGPSYRINHSCNPSARQMFVLEKGRPPQLAIEILRHVPINEEIYITYNSELNHMPVNKRRQELLKTYNFRCRCTQCLEEEQQFLKDNV